LVSPRRRRRTNWTALLAVAVVVAFGVAAYVFVGQGGHAQHQHQATSHHRPKLARQKAPTTSPTPARYVREVVIRLSAVADCWVEFTTPGGRYLSQYFLPAGTSQTWAFGRAVDMRLGNPAGVKLIVNGKNPLPAGAKQPITLALVLSGSSG
jgi:hypothetical protein